MPQVLVLLILTLWLPRILHPLQTSVDASRRSCNSRRVHGSGGKCQRFNRFLQDVLKAREELTWIDQVADEMRSKELFSVSSSLRDKINAMFFTHNKAVEVWDSLKNEYPAASRSRQKRNSRTSSPEAASPEKSMASPRIDFNSGEYENASLHGGIFDSALEAEEDEVVATTPDPLEVALGSINVFPVDEDPHAIRTAGDFTAAAASRAINDDRPGEPRLRVGRALKSIFSAGNKKKNWSELLSNDAHNDKFQMNRALSGDLARDIVNAIFSEVGDKKAIDSLSNAVVHRYSAPLDPAISQNVGNHESINESGQSDSITKKLMRFMHQLVSEEVEKKKCDSLSAEMHEFLNWLVESDVNYETVAVEDKKEKFLENSDLENSPTPTLNEWYRKADTLKGLLRDYELLSKSQKNKVQAIHEYLLTRLEFVEAYIKTLQAQTSDNKKLNKR